MSWPQRSREHKMWLTTDDYLLWLPRSDWWCWFWWWIQLKQPRNTNNLAWQPWQERRNVISSHRSTKELVACISNLLKFHLQVDNNSHGTWMTALKARCNIEAAKLIQQTSYLLRLHPYVEVAHVCTNIRTHSKPLSNEASWARPMPGIPWLETFSLCKKIMWHMLSP